jgi:hypothetical protein
VHMRTREDAARTMDGRTCVGTNELDSGTARGMWQQGQWVTVNKEEQGQWMTVAKVSQSASQS